MRVGTKSMLFGVHNFLVHAPLVGIAWWKLYGFPRGTLAEVADAAVARVMEPSNGRSGQSSFFNLRSALDEIYDLRLDRPRPGLSRDEPRIDPLAPPCFAAYSASRSVGCSATRFSPPRLVGGLPGEYVAGHRRVECRLCNAPDGSP